MFLSHQLFVGGGVHQAVEICRIRELKFDDPAVTVRIGVDFVRIVVQGFVDFDYLTGNREKQVRNRFHRFNRTENFIGCQVLVNRVDFNEDNVTQLVLCIIGNTYQGYISINQLNPFVFSCVAEICGKVHVFAMTIFAKLCAS